MVAAATLTGPEAAQRPAASPIPLSAENRDPAPAWGEVIIFMATYDVPKMEGRRGVLHGRAQYLACFLQCQRIQEHLSHR